MPLLMFVVSPAGALVPIVSAASLGFLAFLGAIGARVGGANVLRGTVRVIFWGVGDGLHCRYREIVGHGCLKFSRLKSAPGWNRSQNFLPHWQVLPSELCHSLDLVHGPLSAARVSRLSVGYGESFCHAALESAR